MKILTAPKEFVFSLLYFPNFEFHYLYFQICIFKYILQELAGGLSPFITVGSLQADFLWILSLNILENFWFDPHIFNNINQMRGAIKSIIVQPHIIKSNLNVGHHITKYLN